MQKVGIVTDSASGLYDYPLKDRLISVVPISICIGDKNYKDGVDLPVQEFYKKLTGKIMPKTSSPPPIDFVAAYRKMAEKVDSIISIHVTKDGSATCDAAYLAAKLSPGVDVTVYDSKAVSMGVGFMALEAEKYARNGLGKEEILEKLDSIRDGLKTVVAIPTLSYLQRSGRVRKGQAVLASLLCIKPVLEIKDGMLKVSDTVRTFQNALGKILDLASDSAGNIPVTIAVMHANVKEEAEKFAEKVKERLNTKNIYVGEVGPALAIHGGPGMIGIVFYPKDTVD